MASTLFLDEACVKTLIGMPDALEAIEEVFREQGAGNVVNVPRVRAPVEGGTLRITAAVLSYRGYYGVKISPSTNFHTATGRVFCLYRDGTGELVAIVQVFALGALRTGAASGIATKYLANRDAAILGVLGSGRQAATQVDAILNVRNIREIRVYSPTEAHRTAFGSSVTARHRADVIAVDSPQAAVTNADVLVTATRASEPVVRGEWLKPGVHINAVGANFEYRRELDSAAVAAAHVIATDDTEQVRYEGSDLVHPVNEGLLDWDRVYSLGEIVAGRRPGRAAASDITLFKSLGVAIEDVALAARAYEKARDQGVGQVLPHLAG
jgi:ornithine cyclodeaminase/alanine dehydrogenase-like protein (mu-crystallin family)